MKNISVAFLVLLFTSAAWADYTCTVPTDGTFAECIVACANKTGAVTISLAAGEHAVGSISMAYWVADSVTISGVSRDTVSTVDAYRTFTANPNIPFNISGITFNGSLKLDGSPRRFTVHDNEFSPGATLYIDWTGGPGHPYGVVYNNKLRKVSVIPTSANRYSYIHALFNQLPPSLSSVGGGGSADNGVVYIEGNTYPDRGRGYLTDSENGGRYVFRFNTISAIASNANLANHGIDPASRYMRGAQMWEYYNNKYDNSAYSLSYTQIRSGTGLFFNNDIYPTSSGMQYIYIDDFRSFYNISGYTVDLEYTIAGACRGDNPFDGNATIDHTQAALLTRYGNTTFSGTHTGENNAAVLTDSTKAWNSNALIGGSGYGKGATIYNTTAGKESWCWITANTENTITCTLSEGQDWDAGDTYRITDGYPCRDQVGRGYDSTLFVNKTETPNAAQTLYPLYVWGNLRNGVAENSVATSNSKHHILNNRDYYSQEDASCAAGGACTTGVGTGTTLPTSCTTGVGFWKSNESALYKCTSTDTWTEYYSPAPCPHPLTGYAAGTCDYTKYGTEGYILGDPNPVVYYPLALTIAGDGSGTVISSPSGINTSVTTSVNFEKDTEVTLTATPSGDDTVAWSGTDGAECTGLTCTVTMSAARAVTATFTDVAPVQWVVTRSYVGSGSTSPAEGDEVVNNDATATTTQTPSDHWTFTGWSGTCGCTGTDSCAPTVTANCTIVATWTEDAKKSITITFPDNGELIVSDKCGLYCGQVDGNYDCACDWYAEDVTLTCTPATGYYGCTMTGDDCTSGVCTPNDQTVTVTSTNGRAATINRDGATATATINRDGSTATATIVR